MKAGQDVVVQIAKEPLGSSLHCDRPVWVKLLNDDITATSFAAVIDEGWASVVSRVRRCPSVVAKTSPRV